MTHQASKLVEMVGDPEECKHGRVLLDGSKCLYCKHEDQLAVKDVEIARMDDALAKALEINENSQEQIKIRDGLIKSFQAKIISLEDQLDISLSMEN